MPVGHGRNVDAEDHLSQNSECGVVGYSSSMRLNNNNNKREKNLLLLFIIYLFSSLSIV